MAYTTYKRWALRDPADLGAVAALVRERIVPHYRRLSDEVELGLEVIEGEAAVLAVQHWADRDAHDRAMASAGFATWWDDYQPVLQLWDALVTFEDEWATESVG